MTKHIQLIIRYTFLIGFFSLMTSTGKAEENLWVYTKGTDTRPKGSFELKFTDIVRWDKDSGDYTFHDIRPEIEYGITDRLTVGLELMIFHHDYLVDDPDLQPMADTQGGKRFKDTQIGGFELAMKYNILSPYKDFIGLSLGFAYEYRDVYRLDGADIEKDSFVPMIFIQKNFIDNRLTLAFTGKVEFERRKSPDVLEEEIAFEGSVGIAYRFSSRWFIGWEVRYQADFLNPQEGGEFDPDLERSSWDFSDIRLGSNHQYAFYTGPSIHYAEEGWWVTVGLLHQFHGDCSRHAYNKDGRNYDEHERFHLGTSIGFEF